MSATTIFSNITYLNDSNGWTEMNLQTVGIFFFVDKKCFLIRTGIEEYRSSQVYLSNDREVLKVHFNLSYFNKEIKPNRTEVTFTTHFMTSTSSKMRFSKISSLYYNQKEMKISQYSINQELFTVERADKFNFIKFLFESPFALFSGQNAVNDIDAYLGSLLRNFKDTSHLVTLNMPVKKSLFGYEIEDTLFEQYFMQITNKSNHEMPANLNYQR